MDFLQVNPPASPSDIRQPPDSPSSSLPQTFSGFPHPHHVPVILNSPGTYQPSPLPLGLGSHTPLAPLSSVHQSTTYHTLLGESSCDGSEIHKEMLNFCRQSGIEEIAKDAGIIKNGCIPEFREYSNSNSNSNIDLPHSPASQVLNTNTTTPATCTTNLLSKINPAIITYCTKENVQSSITTNSDIGIIHSTPLKKRKLDNISVETSPGTSASQQKGGLRHFSMKVCNQVEAKKVTAYNEVADELVNEFGNGATRPSAVEQKNIRRRVYDVLNVLTALNIIQKEKKEIRWCGLPSQKTISVEMELDRLEKERIERGTETQRKFQQLLDLYLQHQTNCSLRKRNRQHNFLCDTAARITLPFIIIKTKSDTLIQCEVASDRSTYFFNFSRPFEINDDQEILRRMNLVKPLSSETQTMLLGGVLQLSSLLAQNDEPED